MSLISLATLMPGYGVTSAFIVYSLYFLDFLVCLKQQSYPLLFLRISKPSLHGGSGLFLVHYLMAYSGH